MIEKKPAKKGMNGRAWLLLLGALLMLFLAYHLAVLLHLNVPIA